ncbi:hypothetical protein [Photobacterium sp. GB-72]|uniref:hypothetical protein n=1 Tax=Photobacterium sp. GB-72 TaxID=2022105 RepID=UPI000D1521B0|nr:hypothetical protein [Photobacterium sp. GB-72]PSV28049.1 hypothetical protein C9J40_19410 [Photobacterium sp. GB-72]
MKSLIAALILPLILIGFLTNSVAMRFLGKIDGSVSYPLLALLCNVVFALILFHRISKKL